MVWCSYYVRFVFECEPPVQGVIGPKGASNVLATGSAPTFFQQAGFSRSMAWSAETVHASRLNVWQI